MIANSILAKHSWMTGTASDKDFIIRLVDHVGVAASEVARRAGLAVSTLTRPLNQPVKYRLSKATIDKLKETYPDFADWAPPKPAGRASDLPAIRNASEGETTPIIALDLSLSMGPGTPIEDFVESEPVEFDIGMLRTITRSPYHRLRVVRGIGNSMEPKFYTGDRILVDTTERTLSRIDGYYWITLWGAHGLKRLRPIGPQRVLVLSENPEHDPIEVDAAELTIEGRAIWFGRDL